MPYTMENFRREFVKGFLKELTPEEQQQAIKGLTPEQRLKNLTPEQVLEALTPEQLERLRQQLMTERGPGQSEKRRRK